MNNIIGRFQMYFHVIGILTLCLILSACGNPSNKPIPPEPVSLPELAFTGNYEFQFQRTLAPTGNDLYTLVVEVINQGQTPVQQVQVVAYSKGPGIKGYKEPLDNNGYYSIGAGEKIFARFQFIFEKQFGGNYEFTFTLDPTNTVQEENKSNNKLVFNKKF